MTAEPQAARPEHVPANPDMPLSELTTRLHDEVRELVHAEIALAKTEALHRAKRMGVGVGMFGTAGLLAFFAGGCAVAAFVLGLSNVARPWLAALIVAGVLLVVAVFVALPGRRGFRAQHPPVPANSLESIKADADAVRTAVHK